MLQAILNINETTIKLTDRQLLDYIKCPNLFYIKYLTKIPVPPAKSFSYLVSEVINAYYGRLLEGKLPTMERLKKIWDKLCEDNPKVINEKKVVEGWGLIKSFDRYCYNNKIIIADTATPYSLELGPLITVTGTISTLRVNNGVVELFIVDCGAKQPDQMLLDMSLKYTLQLYALNQLTDKAKISCIRVLHLKSGNEYTSYRNKKDFDRLERIVNNVAKAIRNDIYYPREDFTCLQCNFKNYCGHL